MDNTQITVTSPLLPDLDELDAYIRDIWSRKWITNNGFYHKELEKALCEYLKVPYVSLFTHNHAFQLRCDNPLSLVERHQAGVRGHRPV